MITYGPLTLAMLMALRLILPVLIPSLASSRVASMVSAGSHGDSSHSNMVAKPRPVAFVFDIEPNAENPREDDDVMQIFVKTRAERPSLWMSRLATP